MLAGTNVAGADDRETVMSLAGDPDRRRRPRRLGHGVDQLGIKRAQGVVAAPGQLAGHREGGPLAAMGGFGVCRL